MVYKYPEYCVAVKKNKVNPCDKKKKIVSKTLSIPAKYVIQQYKYHGATCSAKNCTQHYVFLHTQHYVFLHIHADHLSVKIYKVE